MAKNSVDIKDMAVPVEGSHVSPRRYVVMNLIRLLLKLLYSTFRKYCGEQLNFEMKYVPFSSTY